MRLLTHDLSADRAGLQPAVRSAAPDVVCVHGAPSALRWRARCAALARSCGLVVVCGGRSAGSNLIMSTLGVDEVSVASVRGGGWLRSDGVAVAVLRVRGLSLVVLAGTPDPRTLGEQIPDDLPSVLVAPIAPDGYSRIGGGVFADPRLAARRVGAAVDLELR